MEKHWEEARIEAEIVSATSGNAVQVSTKNVTAFSLVYAPVLDAQLVVDGTPLGKLGSQGKLVSGAAVVKTAGKWATTKLPFQSFMTKFSGHQGPIDDAFMDSFVMVRPTGQPLNAAVGQWAKTELAEAAFHWRRYFRGEPRVKDDSAITDDDIKQSNLVLWGDPSSNKLLARIADKLPIKWNGKTIQVGGKSYDATKHVPVFIFPNPLNPSRYVVINTGFTFPQFAATTNSQQTPKLPDWAILDLSVPLADRMHGKGVVDANFFGEKWEVK